MPHIHLTCAMQQLMDIACLQGSQQQTHHTLLQQSNGTDPAAYYASSVNKLGLAPVPGSLLISGYL